MITSISKGDILTDKNQNEAKVIYVYNGGEMVYIKYFSSMPIQINIYALEDLNKMGFKKKDVCPTCHKEK